METKETPPSGDRGYYDTPRFTAEQAVGFLKDNWVVSDIKSTQSMPSYEDQNFHITTEDGEFTLKFSNRQVALRDIRNQNALLVALDRAGIECSLALAVPSGPKRVTPRVAIATNTAPGPDIAHFARLLRFLPGRMLHDVRLDEGGYTQLGQSIGQLSRVLMKFPSTDPPQNPMWDLEYVGRVCKEVFGQYEVPKEVSAAISFFYSYYQEHVAPTVPKLRQSIIHGDLNDANVLVEEDKDQGTRFRFIDWEDFGCSRLVYELAICCGYMMLGQEDPLSVAMPIIQGFHKTCPLTTEELGVVLPLAAMRIVCSVVMGAKAISQDPENEYLLLHARPGRAFLVLARSWDWPAVNKRVRDACS